MLEKLDFWPLNIGKKNEDTNKSFEKVNVNMVVNRKTTTNNSLNNKRRQELEKVKFRVCAHDDNVYKGRIWLDDDFPSAIEVLKLLDLNASDFVVILSDEMSKMAICPRDIVAVISPFDNKKITTKTKRYF